MNKKQNIWKTPIISNKIIDSFCCNIPLFINPSKNMKIIMDMIIKPKNIIKNKLIYFISGYPVFIGNPTFINKQLVSRMMDNRE